jgi:hypothetical protein
MSRAGPLKRPEGLSLSVSPRDEKPLSPAFVGTVHASKNFVGIV